MSAKTEWMLSATYQKMFEKAKAILKDVCMKFYDETKPLYIETDASGVGVGAALLQTRSNKSCHRDKVPDNSILRPIAFASKSLTGTEKRYSTIQREALAILYRSLLFAREVSIIMDHKPPVAIFKKGRAILSKRPQ